MLIARMDHLALAVPDVDAAAQQHALLLGQAPVALPGGARRLACENIALHLEAADADTAVAATLPLRLVFAATDFEAARQRLVRRGLPGVMRGWEFALDSAATHGVAIALIDADAGAAASAAASDIVGLDHVVVRTRNADRALALYGGRLGLDLRLDRMRAEIGVRQMFFVLGGLVVEVVQSLKEPAEAAPDSIWGLAWRSRDIDASRQRLLSAGIEVTEIRDGRKAGTRVATVKSHTSGVPTLLIGGDGLERS